MATIPRAPLYSPNPRLPQQQFDLFPNLLVTTLAVAAAAVPFSNPDWPTPRAQRAPQVDVVPNLLTTTLAPSPFVRPFDWSSPKSVQQLDGFAIPNVTINQAAAPVAKINPIDWSSPKSTQRLDRFDIPNLTVRLPIPVQGQFKPLDWPFAKSVQQKDKFDIPNVTAKLPVGLAPFKVVDWSVQLNRTSSYRFEFNPPNTTIRLASAGTSHPERTKMGVGT
jgi:hypothetical protein